VKAISVRQPWAYAILHLGKRVENRDWRGCSYRGPVLIHAAKTLVLRVFDEDVGSGARAPYKGALGLFDVPDELVHEAEERAHLDRLAARNEAPEARRS